MRAEDSLRAMEQENNINKAEQQHEENEEKSLRTGKKNIFKGPKWTRAKALKVIAEHNASDPLFLNYNMHVIHEPLQAPHSYFEAQAARTNATFPDAAAQPRAIYHSMVKFADDTLGSLVTALKEKSMWADTLVVTTR